MAPVLAREVGAFVVRLGTDTVALEQFSRTATGLEGQLVVRTPRTAWREYTATLAPDGTISQFEIHFRTQPGGPATTHATIDFAADTATVRLTRDGELETFRVAAPAGSIPSVGLSLAMYELAFAQLRGQQDERLTTALVPLGAETAFPLTLRRLGSDSVQVDGPVGTSRARVDGEGRLLAWDGTGSTLQIQADRAVALDLDRLAADYAARDAAGRGLGTLSPRDTMQAAVAGATLSVAYGRPFTRGRQIFGNVVPFGQVWRTGANLATTLTTDRDLTFGTTRVPAGSYSLFTIPAPESWELIINRQTGQSGTEHDPTHDVVRVPMRTERLGETVEQFTITIEASGEGGVLSMAWDDTRASVPFRVQD